MTHPLRSSSTVEADSRWTLTTSGRSISWLLFPMMERLGVCEGWRVKIRNPVSLRLPGVEGSRAYIPPVFLSDMRVPHDTRQRRFPLTVSPVERAWAALPWLSIPSKPQQRIGCGSSAKTDALVSTPLPSPTPRSGWHDDVLIPHVQKLHLSLNDHDQGRG